MLVNRLTNVIIKNTKSKDVLSDLMIPEWIICLLQNKTRQHILNEINDLFNVTRVGTAVQYVQDNLRINDLILDDVSKRAFINKSYFFKKFKSALRV